MAPLLLLAPWVGSRGEHLVALQIAQKRLRMLWLAVGECGEMQLPSPSLITLKQLGQAVKSRGREGEGKEGKGEKERGRGGRGEGKEREERVKERGRE
jgi:hypothetical protein